MKISIKPPDNKKTRSGKKRSPRLGLPAPQTALAFKKAEIRQLAFRRNFKLELLPKTAEHVEVLVTDGRNKKYTIQYFDRNRTAACCSCDDYVLDEARMCLHVAAIENLLDFPVHYTRNKDYHKWCNIFRIRLARTPKRYIQKYDFWDAYKNKNVEFGERGPAVETVSTKTYKKIQRQRKNSKVKYLPTPNDEGLLEGVTLYDYQKDIFAKMLTAQRAVCSMSMGLGKTLTTIACYAFVVKHKPGATMLVIAPKSLRYQWGNEIKRTCGKEVLQIEKPKDLENFTDFDVVVVTYQFLTRHIKKLAKPKWDMIVIDEIQFVRNKQTKSWKALNQLKSDFIFGLSGTVIENNLDDLYSVMEIINPGALGPLWKFNHLFQNLKIQSRTKLIYSGVKNLDMLQDRLKDHIFSYSKLNLQPIQHQVVNIQISQAQRSYHDSAYEEAKVLIAKILNGQSSFRLKIMVQALLLKARQACNTEELITKTVSKPSPKIQEFVKLVDTVCNQGNEKLVVFSDWVEMLKICDREVKHKYNISTVFFTGEQNSKQREDAVKKFQSDPNTKVFFASNAGGVGLDGLQLAARHIVHTDIPWNPAIIDQRNGRLHRILQQNNVVAYYLMTTGTIEEHVYGLSQDKRDVRTQTLAKFVLNQD